MARTATDYKNRMARMLPRGLDWVRVDVLVGQVLAGLGRTGARAETDVVAPVIRDAVPTRCEGERLERWESTLALPDMDRPTVDPGDVPARQVEVGRGLAAGGTPTLALLAAQATVWGLTARAIEADDFPCGIWVLGPAAHVKAFRFGTSTFGDQFLYQSDTWKKVMRLVVRLRQGHCRVHTEDDVGA